MTVHNFFDLFIEELKNSPDMRNYYRFINDEKKHFEFRKAYFVQRLQYVAEQINKPNPVIFDCGCGYGTTALFLAMNGLKVYGTTLEFYFDAIENRKKYWSQYGNTDLFEVDYANIFDNKFSNNSFDYIILQDVLHHLEPINEALEIFSAILKPAGKLVVTDENGKNIAARIKLFMRRGNKRIIKIWDDRLQKNILLGNENTRSWQQWYHILNKNNFNVNNADVQYIRFYPPNSFKNQTTEQVIEKENVLYNKNHFLRDYFFWGLNFIATANK